MLQLPRTAYVLLGMLAIEPNRSGYDLRKAIESSVGYFWGESYGQIYPTLKLLVGEGLIATSGSRAKQRRQEFSITAAGRDRLRAWLSLPFQNDPPRNEFLLKLFFAGEASPAVAIGHIRDLNERNRSALEQMLSIQQVAPRVNAGRRDLPYWMLTLELGIAMTRAALQWGEESLRDLEPTATDSLPHPPAKTQEPV